MKIEDFFNKDPMYYAQYNDFYKRGANIEYIDEDTLLLYNKEIDIVYHTGKRIDHRAFKVAKYVFTDNKEVSDYYLNDQTRIDSFAVKTLYHKGEIPNRIEVEGLSQRLLTIDDLEYVQKNYQSPFTNGDDMLKRIEEGMLGLLVNDELVGFIGLHSEGTMGYLYVSKNHRNKGFAFILENNLIHYLESKGELAYCHVLVDNNASLNLQTKLSLIPLKHSFYWMA